MSNYDDITKENIKEHNSNVPQILDHLYRKLVIGRSCSLKTKAFHNLIKQRNDDNYTIIDKNYVSVKDPIKVKYYKKKHEKFVKIQRLLLNIQMIWRMSIKILRSTT